MVIPLSYFYFHFFFSFFLVLSSFVQVFCTMYEKEYTKIKERYGAVITERLRSTAFLYTIMFWIQDRTGLHSPASLLIEHMVYVPDDTI